MTSHERKLMESVSDAQAVASVLNGDKRAFDVLVNKYEHRLVHFVTRMTGDPQTAQDIVQEVFFRVYRNLQRFDPNRNFSAWIYTIASNLGKNEIRLRTNRPIVLFQTLEDVRDTEGFANSLDFGTEEMRPDRLFEKRELRTLVEEAIMHITIPRRQVFVLREMEGKDYLQIAQIVEVPMGTVKSRLFRAREEFKEFIGPYLH